MGKAEKIFAGSYNAKRGVLDWNGDIIIPFDYADISNTEENWSVLSVVKLVDGKPKYGYIYANGVEMLPCVYSRTEMFSNGCGAVEKDGKYAAINANAVFLTQFIYDSMEPFHEGLAIVVKSAAETGARSLGMIDTNGQEVFPCKYFSLSQSANGIVVAQESEVSPSIQLENPLVKSREINIYKNGVWIYTNQESVIKNDRALAPLRAISESLGFTVDWNAQSQQITLQDNKRVIRLTIGSNEATLNFLDDGKEPETILLDSAPEIINGRTLVPVRFIAESTGADVFWDSATQNINITDIYELKSVSVSAQDKDGYVSLYLINKTKLADGNIKVTGLIKINKDVSGKTVSFANQCVISNLLTQPLQKGQTRDFTASMEVDDVASYPVTVKGWDIPSPFIKGMIGGPTSELALRFAGKPADQSISIGKGYFQGDSISVLNAADKPLKLSFMKLTYIIYKVENGKDKLVCSYNVPEFDGGSFAFPAGTGSQLTLPAWDFKDLNGNLVSPGKYAIQLSMPANFEYIIDGKAKTLPIKENMWNERYEFTLVN